MQDRNLPNYMNPGQVEEGLSCLPLIQQPASIISSGQVLVAPAQKRKGGEEVKGLKDKLFKWSAKKKRWIEVKNVRSSRQAIRCLEIRAEKIIKILEGRNK